LDKLFNCKKTGFYVEVGAADPIRFSNTYRFYKKGWRGVLVEPNTTRIEKLKTCRPQDKIFNLGISDTVGNLNFYIFNPANVSTFSDKGRDINISNNYALESTVKVTVISLGELFNETKSMHNNSIDFITVDTEGNDMPVLKSNKWDVYRPKYVMVECIKGDTRDAGKEAFVKYMNSVGYEDVFYNDLNLIFKDVNLYKF
jgi:FkbM family methyltransferase